MCCGHEGLVSFRMSSRLGPYIPKVVPVSAGSGSCRAKRQCGLRPCRTRQRGWRSGA